MTGTQLRPAALAAPTDPQVVIGPGQKKSENAFVGGENRWAYDTFVNWEFWWPSFPVLVYFKVQSAGGRAGRGAGGGAGGGAVLLAVGRAHHVSCLPGFPALLLTAPAHFGQRMFIFAFVVGPQETQTKPEGQVRCRWVLGSTSPPPAHNSTGSRVGRRAFCIGLLPTACPDSQLLPVRTSHACTMPSGQIPQ